MRRNKLAFRLALVAIGAWPLGAQSAPAALTVQQVIARSLAARGGAAKFAAVRSLEFTGHLQLGNNPAPLHVWTLPNPSRIRIELQLPEGKLIQGYDGAIAWQIPPGKTAAIVLTGEAQKNVVDQAIAFVDLMADPGVKAELLGRSAFEGRDCYRLRFKMITGDSFTQYIDAKTWLPFHEEYPGGVEEIADFRPVDGILLPFRSVSGPEGQIGVLLVRDQVTLNAPINPSIFRRP